VNILIESLPFAVMTTDSNRTIPSVNQRFIDNFMADRPEGIGNPVEFLFYLTV
jgi:hypothetical protein